jgi:hypothetical protein
METPRNQDRARLCLNSRASVDKLSYGNLRVLYSSGLPALNGRVLAIPIRGVKLCHRIL